MNNYELKTYSFTDEDINLITFALRRLKENTAFPNIKKDSENLLQYIERLKNDMPKEVTLKELDNIKTKKA